MRPYKVALITFVITVVVTIIYANLRDPYEELPYALKSSLSVRDPAFARTLGDLLDPSFVEGNSVTTLLNGDEIFPAMLEAIKSAKHSITLESYIYWKGHTGEQFSAELSEKARAGVHVHVLLDWAGSGKIDPAMIDKMRSAGVEVERFHKPRWYSITRMNNRTHRKIMVVDGTIGFTGGVGIADEWGGNGLDPEHWRDTHFRVEGPVVNQMQSAFMDNWLKTRPEIHLNEEYFPKLKPHGSMQAQMFISDAGEGGSNVRVMYLAAIFAARETIDLQSAYFVPDDHTVDALIAARKRGVKIRIMVPGPHVDSEVVDFASRDLWGRLLAEGVEFYQYQPALFHCKVLIVDQDLVSVGSTNFDQRSFSLNDEANLNVIDPGFASVQEANFARDLSHAHVVTLDEWQHRPLAEKLWSKFIALSSFEL